MEIKIGNQEGVSVVQFIGSLDGNTSPEAQEKILPLTSSKCCLVLDLSQCSYISSAGLRVLLMTAKQIAAQGGKLALAGVCDEVRDVMDMTGFINFFKLCNTVKEAIGNTKKES
jgi:anti-anti-sigma factor